MMELKNITWWFNWNKREHLKYFSQLLPTFGTVIVLVTVIAGKKRNKIHSTHPDRPERPTARQGSFLSDACVSSVTSPSYNQSGAGTLKKQTFRGASKHLHTIKQVSDAEGRGSIIALYVRAVCAYTSTRHRLYSSRLVVCNCCEFWNIYEVFIDEF